MTKQKREWLDWLKAVLIACGLVFIVRTFFFTPMIVDGPSMLPTLHDRDHMIVNKFRYQILEPKRFEIVVFHASNEKDFIKRVIGLPGEHVAVRDNILYINGEEVDEPFLADLKANIKHYQTLTGDFTLEELPGGFEKIPEGHVFVLGDNRGNSIDSRSLGPISIDEIVGKANLIYWPFDRMELLGE